MNHYQTLSLADCWPYREVTFDIPKGVSTIYGLNRTSRGSRNANGSGKSFLLSQIHEIQFNAPALGTTQDRTKRGRRNLTIVNHKGKKVEIQVSGRSANLLVDGTSVAKGTTAVGKEISRYVPITRDEFNTYVYFDSRIGHPLVMGSSAERKRFFTSFFQLDKLDVERKIFTQALNRLKKDRALYNELRSQYRKLEQVDVEPLRLAMKKYQKQLDRLADSQKEWQEQQMYQAFLKSSKRQRKICEQYVGTLTSASLEDLQRNAEADYRAHRQYLRDLERYEEYLEELKDYKKSLKSIDRKWLSVDLKDLRADHVLYRDLLDQIQNIKRRLSRYMAQEPKPVKEVKWSVAECKEAVELWTHRASHAAKFGSGKCPTCGQSVDVDPDKDQAQLEKWEKRLIAARTYAAYRQELKDFRQEQKECGDLRTKLDELVAQAKKLKPRSAAYVELSKLPPKPEPVEKPEPVTDGEKAEELLDAVRYLMPNQHMLDFKPRAVKDNSDKVREYSTKLANIQSKLAVAELQNKQRRELKSRLLELKRGLKDEQALSVLVEGYGDKQIKRMVVRQISQLLMEQVNKYARVVFPETYTFELVWDTQIELLCHRKYGNRVETSDVRKLSGAEYKLFSLVLVMSLLAFVPPQKRSSVLILDEPSANMHEETRQAFVQFLDVMVKVIPSIVIITPRSDEHYPGRSFTVVKEKGYSRLVEGHPSEVK